MKYLRFLGAMAALAMIIASNSLPARAELSAAQVWQKVQQQVRATKSYTLEYDYAGPKGQFHFDYAVVRPNQVKTKIVKGDNAGAVLIYNPDEFGNTVKARKGWLGKSMGLNDPKVAGTPIIQPVYDMLLEKTRNASNIQLGAAMSVNGVPTYVLTMTDANGKGHTVAVDRSTFWVLHWKYTDNEGVQDRTFLNIKPNSNPRIDF